jgi:hypothetical protein
MGEAPSAERAIAFIRARGAAVDQAWLKVLLREPLTDADLALITEAQNPDGGFRVAELKTRQSVVGRTAEMLLYLVALGAGDFGSAQAAADFLIEHQTAEGTWEEPESLRASGPPPHFSPGSNDVTGWETAAAIVSLTGIGLTLDFHSALEWIRSRRIHQRSGRLFRLEVMLAWAAFFRHEGPESESARRLAEEVEALPTKDLAVFELNWGLLAAGAVGVPNAHPVVQAFAASLALQQREGGGFGSGPEPSGYETVLALCALEHAGRLRLAKVAHAGGAEPDPANSDHGI